MPTECVRHRSGRGVTTASSMRYLGPADRLKGRDVTTQNRLHILVQHEARPVQPFWAERDWVIDLPPSPGRALGTGGAINWGIFKRRFWGELLRHQQLDR